MRLNAPVSTPTDDTGGAEPAAVPSAAGTRPRRWSADLPPATAGAILRERLYGSIACLSTLLVLTQPSTAESGAGYALLDVAIATGGLFGASLFAEFVSHLGVRGERLHRSDWKILLGTSGQIVEAALVPMALLAVSALGWWRFSTALWTSVWVLVVQMGVFSFFAVRRSGLSWFGRVLTIVAIIVFALVVVAVKTLAH